MGPHSLSPLLPCPGRTRSSLLSKDLPSPSARLFRWVRVVSPGSHSPFAPISLTPVLPSAGQPWEPHSQHEDTLAPFWQLLPAANSRGWGQTRLWGLMREGGREWACGQHLPVTWDLPLSTSHFGLLMAASLYVPLPPPCPQLHAPVALLWIRVTRGEVRMQSPRLHSQRSDPGGHTVGPGNLNFYQASQWIGGLGCRGSCEHSEKHLIDLPLTSVGPG